MRKAGPADPTFADLAAACLADKAFADPVGKILRGLITADDLHAATLQAAAVDGLCNGPADLHPRGPA